HQARRGFPQMRLGRSGLALAIALGMCATIVGPAVVSAADAGSAATPGAAPSASSAKSPRLLVHLLDYVAQDYGGAVANGRVTSENEYREQLEFSRNALEMSE